MLTRLSVENFLCFGEPASLALLPQAVGPTGNRVALIGGENAVGKSSLQKALSCLRSLVLGGSKLPLPIPAHLFAPVAASRLEIEIEQEGAHYRYGFAATSERIVEEWLERTPHGAAPELLFRRHYSEAKPVSVELGPPLAADRQRLELVVYGTRPEQLFLSEGLRRGVRPFLPLGVWLRDRLQLILPEAKTVGLAARAARDPAFATFLGELLAVVEPSVSAIEVQRQSIGPDGFESPEQQRELVDALTQYPDAFAETDEGELIAEREGSFVDLYRVKASLLLSGPGDLQAELPLGELSDGMKRLLHLAPLLYRRAGSAPVFFLDDLDRGLHPRLIQTLLARFAATDGEPAQLIATLQAPEQLAAALPTGTQIWKLERGESGARLQPLAG